MAVFGAGDLKNLPRNIAAGMVTKVRTGSTVAALSNREPMKFGNVDIITFDDFPKAEFVEASAQKSSTGGGFGVVTAVPHKAQVTMRFEQEVQWADEDYQLDVLNSLADAGSVSLARALDLGVYYRINPLTGTEITDWSNYLNSTTNRVSSGNPDAMVEAAVGLLTQNGKLVNGLAMDPKLSYALATQRDQLGRRLYPELGFGVNVTAFDGLPASISNTVSGQDEGPDNGNVGIVGDFQNRLRWGIQRDIPLELIQYGDPDGQGDLKRQNQIALRLEIVYGWYVFPDYFSVIGAAPAA